MTMIRLENGSLICTREQKLAAVGLATNGEVTTADGSQHSVSKYCIAKRLGITTAMLRKWMKDSSNIEAMSRKKRNNAGCIHTAR